MRSSCGICSVFVELEKENKYEVSGKNLKGFLDMIDSGKINEVENLLLDWLDLAIMLAQDSRQFLMCGSWKDG